MSAPFSPPSRGRTLLLAAVALAGLVAGVSLALQGRAPEAITTAAASDEETRALETLQASLQRSQVLPKDFRRVPEFDLRDADGEPLGEGILDGRWSLAFFGYTNCPDICPVTLQVLKGVVERLEATGEPAPQVLFVTIDPARDTAARMREYIGYFDEDFVGVTGEQGTLHDLARALGIIATFTANDEYPSAYTVDHTASLLLIDPQRRVRAKLTAPHEVETIVADYRALRAGLS